MSMSLRIIVGLDECHLFTGEMISPMYRKNSCKGFFAYAFRTTQNDEFIHILQASKSVVSENRVKLQQFHDLESEVTSSLNKVQDKAREPVHVVFGTSVKPAVNQVQVCVCSHQYHTDCPATLLSFIEEATTKYTI